MSIVSKSSAAHYTWQKMCDGWPLVARPDLSVKQERMPPAIAEQRHSHTRARQFFFVLSGALTMEIEGVVHVLHAEEGIEIAPGTVHQARNDSDADVAFLVISTPNADGDRS